METFTIRNLPVLSAETFNLSLHKESLKSITNWPLLALSRAQKRMSPSRSARQKSSKLTSSNFLKWSQRKIISSFVWFLEASCIKGKFVKAIYSLVYCSFFLAANAFVCKVCWLQLSNGRVRWKKIVKRTKAKQMIIPNIKETQIKPQGSLLYRREQIQMYKNN